MDGWVGGWVGGWIDGRIDGQMYAQFCATHSNVHASVRIVCRFVFTSSGGGNERDRQSLPTDTQVEKFSCRLVCITGACMQTGV